MFFNNLYCFINFMWQLIPVDTIIGLPNLAIASINGRFVSSPDPVLKNLTLILFSSSAALIENGVHK